MIKEIVIPDIGEKIESGDVVSVLVNKGDTVKQDDPILEFETDKAVVEIPSPDGGRIVEILVESGQTVDVGAVIAKLETNGTGSDAAVASAEKKDQTGRQEQEPRKEEQKPAATQQDSSPRHDEQAAGEADESSQVHAGGPDQRSYRETPETTPARKAETTPVTPYAEPAPASPSVRRLARELGINIDDVIGSGPGGRISNEDVKAHVRRMVSGAASPVTGHTVAVSAELPDFSRWGQVDREPMSKVRTITADNMAVAWHTVPHVTQFDQADVTDVEVFRKKYGKRVEAAGGKLTVTAVLLKVLAAALVKFPKFNASLDMARGEIVFKRFCNIGIAVDTDRGLLVPVIRDADKKSISELAIELTTLAQRTREKKISPDELDGSTFAVSNQGSIGGVDFTPIVYWPQVAILGVSRSAERPVYVNGELEPRSILPLSLSYDHRIIDGAEAARFLDWVARSLEQPFLMSFE